MSSISDNHSTHKSPDLVIDPKHQATHAVRIGVYMVGSRYSFDVDIPLNHTITQFKQQLRDVAGLGSSFPLSAIILQGPSGHILDATKHPQHDTLTVQILGVLGGEGELSSSLVNCCLLSEPATGESGSNDTKHNTPFSWTAPDPGDGSQPRSYMLYPHSAIPFKNQNNNNNNIAKQLL